MTQRKQQLIDDAKAAGFTVVTSESGVVRIRKTHKGNGRVLRGLDLYPDGTAIDATLDLSVAKGVRSYADMRAILGV
jgi:hypothetical protein